MMTISNATYLDFNEFMERLLDYEDIIDKWKERHPNYSAKVNILVGDKTFTIQVIICKGGLKE
jgi:tryptophan 2,3-dioxygenase